MKKLTLNLPLASTVAALLLAGLPFVAGSAPQSAPTKPGDPEVQGEETAVLVAPPNVPPPITRTHATKVIVTLEVKEVTRELDDGVEYNFWTFGGQVPGNFIRVREGDLVEFHLNNDPANKMPHNIDLHAVTGPGGGAASSFTAPGHSSQFSFKALNPGLYVYHCATAPVPMHVGNGMYGMIYVQPKAGLPKVDREYYVMQGEVYTTGAHGDEGFQSFSMDKAVDERPPYVVFNGAVNSLVGDKALKANVGETVRLFVGNGGINLASSFHMIGVIFDTVYQEGGTRPSQNNVQTTLIPAAGSAIVEFKLAVPGTYVMVDHSLTRAFNKGALGTLVAQGASNLLVYSGKEIDAVYLGNQATAGLASDKQVASLEAQVATEIATNPKIAGLTKDIQIERGKGVFMQICFVCHQTTGLGVPKQFPPLAGSDFLMADKDRSIRIVLGGLSGDVVVNGNKYTNQMPPMLTTLTDAQIANVLTYVRNSWGNSGDAVTAAEVRKARAGIGKIVEVKSIYE